MNSIYQDFLKAINSRGGHAPDRYSSVVEAWDDLNLQERHGVLTSLMRLDPESRLEVIGKFTKFMEGKSYTLGF